jgi:hypothetical protein
MTWPLDKLGLINQALALTSNAQVSVVDDGSDEWNVGSAAWEAALEAMFEEHDWGFLTNVQVLQRADTPSDPWYADAYAVPPDCMHIIWVRLAMSNGNDAPVQYQILNNQIVLNAAGFGPPVPPSATKGVVTVKYVSNNNGPETFTPLFMKALRFFVMSGIYRGLNEDYSEANSLYQQATATVAEARSRADQQQPKRAVFNSRLRMSRRVRHPWGRNPLGWTDTGRPN